MSRITRRQAKNRTGLRVANRRPARIGLEALEPRELLSHGAHVLLSYDLGQSRNPTSLAGMGDINRDGLDDILVGVNGYQGFVCCGLSRPLIEPALVLSGGESYVLRTFTVPSEIAPTPPCCGSTRSFWTNTANVGDLTGDGVSDIIVGISGEVGRYVLLFSGSDGSVVFQIDPEAPSFGDAVAGVGDWNRDGYPDFAVGAPSASPGGRANAGSVFIYSGRDKSLVRRFDGEDPGDSLGGSLAVAGDVNRDGVPDLLVGDRGVDFGVDNGKNRVWVFSGADGSVLFRFRGQPGDQLGTSVAEAGDLNEDGHADLLVGAPNADPGAILNAGSVFVHSGFDGSTLYRFDGASEDASLGLRVAGVGDVDGDGTPDVAAVGRTWTASTGTVYHVYTYSGGSGQLIFSHSGSGVSAAGDASGDGRSEVFVVMNNQSYLLSIAERPSDLEGPRVLDSATTPKGIVPGSVDHVDVTFSEPVDLATFTADDIVSFTGPNGSISIIGDPVVLAGTTEKSFSISFQASRIAGITP